MYVISEYEDRYRPRNTKGAELVRAHWLKLPVKPRGRGLMALLREEHGLEFFAIWCLLLQAATEQKPEHRGQLRNHRDHPASPDEIADAISLSSRKSLVKQALSTLVTMGWITEIPDTEEVRREYGVDTDKVSPREEKRREDKSRVEENKKGFRRGEFVLLSDFDLAKLEKRLGSKATAKYIEDLNNYIGSTGKRYKSHYFTILQWANRDKAPAPKSAVELDQLFKETQA